MRLYNNKASNFNKITMDTIFAPITSIISGAVITIRISGKDCLKIKNKFNIIADLKIRYNHLVTLKLAQEIIDQVIIVYYKAPHSYTGEDVIEISIHGSKIIYQRLIKELANITDFRFAEPGEFTKRAFINRKLDLIKAEAVDDLIAAETPLQAKQALQQLYGKNSKVFEEWRAELVKIHSIIEAYIDFPDEDLPEDNIKESYSLISQLKHNIAKVLDDNQVGEVIREGINISIIGPPNSGKSSLINNLSGREIAIVSNISGTTRDAIDVHLNIAGFSVILTDTAGLRKTDDTIEKMGIDKAIEKAQSAHFKILLLPVEELDITEYKNFIDKNTIIVANKIDLLKENILAKLQQNRSDICFISVKENKGINILVDSLEKLIINNYQKQDTIITRERHRNILQNINSELEDIDFSDNLEIISEKLRIVINRLGKMVGTVDIEEILDNIFANFCIGK